VFNANAKALKLLPAKGPRFSVRDWTRGVSEPGSILFLSARYVDMSICSQLLTLWLDTAMNTLMTMERTPDLRIWFLVDELGALHRLPALEKGLQTARNFGGAIVTGVHAFAKLKEVYGENMAMTLSSLARSKLILATADRETATWCSDFIGHRQVRDMEEGYSYGYNNARDAVSLTPRRQIEPLLLPDQFMNLPRLSGYLKFPDGFPAAPVTLVPRRLPRLAEGFIARASEPGPQRAVPDEGAAAGTSSPASRSEPAEGAPAANDDGVGKPAVPRQLKLDLQGVRPTPDEASQKGDEQLRTLPVREARGAFDEAKAEVATEATAAGGTAATLPAGPLLSGRSEATDGAQLSTDEKTMIRGDKPGSSDLKSQPIERPNERQHPRERAERDLLEGGIESGEQDFYEPDL
jgi:hypothetical protein